MVASLTLAVSERWPQWANMKCQRCDGTSLYFGRDEHQLTATCYSCGYEQLEYGVPPIEHIEPRESGWTLAQWQEFMAEHLSSAVADLPA